MTGRQLPVGVPEGDRESPDLGLPDCLFPGRVSTQPASGQGGELEIGQRAAGRVAVGVVAGQEQSA